MAAVKRNKEKAFNTTLANVLFILSMATEIHAYQLAKALGKSQSTILEYLAVLEERGVFKSRTEGRKKKLFTFDFNGPFMSSIFEGAGFDGPYKKLFAIEYMRTVFEWVVLSVNCENLQKAYNHYNKLFYSKSDIDNLNSLGKELSPLILRSSIDAFFIDLSGSEITQTLNALVRKKDITTDEKNTILQCQGELKKLLPTEFEPFMFEQTKDELNKDILRFRKAIKENKAPVLREP